MRNTVPTFVRGALLLFSSFVLFACSGTTTAQPHPDAGVDAGGIGCISDSECNNAFCIDHTCTTCQIAGCPAGATCSTTGKCLTADGGGTTGGIDAGSTGTCTHRSDCPFAQACLDGTCGSPEPDAGCTANDQCPKANICQAHQCNPGCTNNLDCHGTSLPKCIAGNPGHCGPCSLNTDCLNGENCQLGKCVAAQTCTDSSSCGGLGCVAGTCGNCGDSADCTTGTHCDTGSGHCVIDAAGCTGDAQCQAQYQNPAYYCDTGSPPKCQLGCLADSACGTPAPGCCNPSTSTCNATSHSCQPRTGTTGTPTTGTTTTGSTGTTSGTTTTTGTTGTACDCSPCANVGQACDTANNCACIASGTTGGTGTTSTIGGTIGGGTGCDPQGGDGEPCKADCSCDSGLVCGDILYPFDSEMDPSNADDRNSCSSNLDICSFIGSSSYTCQEDFGF